MLATFLQFVISGLTVGAVYALVALGFTLVYNASHVINFAQGEFVMLGGMLAALFIHSGTPPALAVVLAILIPALVGILMEKVAIEPIKGADTITLIIVTLGVSLIVRGIVQVALGKGTHTIPPFSGNEPIRILGATLPTQSLWVFGGTAVAVLLLWYFFSKTISGKAMLATAYNQVASQLTGINTNWVLMMSFALAAAIGAIGGVLVTPITMTSFDAGIMLGLKGFVAAVLGGMGSGPGAVVGGLLVGLIEATAAGYISSAYKDAIPFILILFILFFMPNGLLGKKATDRI